MNKSFTLIDILKEIFLFRKSLFLIIFTCILLSIIFFNFQNMPKDYRYYFKIEIDYQDKDLPDSKLFENTQELFEEMNFFEFNNYEISIKLIKKEIILLIKNKSDLSQDEVNKIIPEIVNKLNNDKSKLINYKKHLISIIESTLPKSNLLATTDKYIDLVVTSSILENANFSLKLIKNKIIDFKFPIYFVLIIGFMVGIVLSFVILYSYIFLIRRNNNFSKSK